MKKLTLVKVGGNVLENPVFLNAFLDSFQAIEGPKWLVHGGGKRSSFVAEKLGIESLFIDGRRVTYSAFLDVAIDTYAGLNKRLVSQLQQRGITALGMSGADLNFVPSKKRNTKPVDFGFVGDPIAGKLNENFVSFFVEQNISLVFSALSFDPELGLLNTNADTIAQTLAIQLAGSFAVELIYAFEKDGVMRNVNDPLSVVSELNSKSISELKSEGIIVDGMIPKVDSAMNAINKGVKNVRISSFKNLNAGTLIQKS